MRCAKTVLSASLRVPGYGRPCLVRDPRFGVRDTGRDAVFVKELAVAVSAGLTLGGPLVEISRLDRHVIASSLDPMACASSAPRAGA